MGNDVRDLGAMPIKNIEIRTGGVYLTRCQFCGLLTFFVVVAILVGLMAGLLRRPCPEYIHNPATVRNHVEKAAIRADPWLDVFLPDYMAPVHYDLYQFPDFYHDGNVFYGWETIEIRIDAETKHLLVHIKDMNVTLTLVSTSEGDSLDIQTTFFYEPNQYWVVELVDTVPGGSTVKLYLEFTGSLTNGEDLVPAR
ncbi:hypothetical protein LSH36_179g02017 [Paralvinella palmiformis]|uniref:Aminopeptidase N-like N-terminal domain-containing protein n=1 Tax=Paralvinella palmiformis TaxID=53620 RepID=A0AAD9N5N2_9ANNE|nr:hypothetical protein LSH36_179g02017 [Paralvinella palmiformis]